MQVPHFGFFVAASVVLFVTPGPAVLYIVTRSLDQGRTAGLVSTCGLHTGTLVHVAAAVAGISALLSSSTLALDVVRWAGAAFLVYLGVRELLPAPQAVALHAPEPRDAPPTPATGPSLRRLFSQGILINVLNPKVALFLLAFMPQFVDASRGAVWRQMAFLGLSFVALGLAIDFLYALAAGSAGGWLRGSRRFARGARYVTGSLYLGLGLAAAFSPIGHPPGAAVPSAVGSAMSGQ